MAGSRTVGIIGAGTMGAGIAQVAVTHGWSARLLDVDEATATKAVQGIRARLDRLVEKGRMRETERDAAAARLEVAAAGGALGGCGLVIEAVVEDLDVKKRVLEAVTPGLDRDAIIATNTSSLSVTALGRAIGRPARTVGMHFFNPAPLMKLVEVIAGDESDPGAVDAAAAIARSWGKEVARARDVPGFIVNHVARPYYLEAFRILEAGEAPADRIDAAMKELGGFRMGPLELTDLIGQDVNTATTRSVWEQLDRPPLLRPSALQESLVEAGHLGRKTGRGVYDYTGDARPAAVTVRGGRFDPAPPLREAVTAFADATVGAGGDWTDRYVLGRVVVALIAQARLAAARGVAAPEDIDLALRFGTNYPRGPFEWAAAAGDARIDALSAALDEHVGEPRFTAVTPSPRSS